MNRLYKMLAVMMVIVLSVSCGQAVVDLSESYVGEHFSFDYPNEWELIEEEAKIKVVLGGAMLQFSVTTDENIILNDLDSISTSLIEMTTSDLEIKSDEVVSLPRNSENDDKVTARWIESLGENGKGLHIFAPINGAVYVIQLSPGRHKNHTMNEAKEIAGTFSVITTTWITETETEPDFIFEPFTSEFWSIGYLNIWEIEKSENSVEFIDTDGSTILSVTTTPFPEGDPTNPESIISYLSANTSGEFVDAEKGIFSRMLSTGDGTNYYLAVKGQVIKVAINNSMDIDTANSVLDSFSYNEERDPGETVNNETSNTDKDNATEDINNNHTTDNSNNSNEATEVKKGKAINRDDYNITVPSGWTFKKESDMTSFVNPPDESSGSFIAIEVQDAVNYPGMTAESIYEIYKSDPSMEVGKMRHVKLGGLDAVQYIIYEDNKSSQIFTLYISKNYFYTIKLMKGSIDYEPQYQAFIEWFEAK